MTTKKTKTITKKNKVIETTRRENGQGSLYQRANGLWACSFYIVNKEGKKVRKHVYAKSRMEAIKKMQDVQGRAFVMTDDLIKGKNFGELCEDWLLVFKKAAVSSRTFEGIFRDFKNHIQPQIGNLEIHEITTQVVQRMLNEMLAKNYAVASCKKIKFIINQFFDYAIDNGWATLNPTHKVRVRGRDEIERYKAIAPQLRSRFVKALDEHELLKPICMTAMYGGLRIGEILALRWQDVDFNNKTLLVNASISQITKFDKEGNVLDRITVIGDTKTSASVREVPIPDILVRVLEDWRKVQWVRKEISKVDLLAPESLMFPNNDGSVRTYSGTRHTLNRFLKRHNLHKHRIQFHTLRHTYSNMLFESGENPKIIQALLGHKEVSTTLIVYNSVDKTYFKQATSRLNDLFNQEHANAHKGGNKPAQAEKREEGQVKTIEDDEELQIEMLEKLLKEKRLKMQKQKEEAEM